ncbi:MAG: hypothetical protein ABW219_13770 [Ilumatobacteraceae bacterium]
MTETDTTTETTDDDSKLLDVYLRDHLAGAHAGLALAERCRSSNDGTALAVLLDAIIPEIADDRDQLQSIMDGLEVTENKLKSMAARAAEAIGRVKSNGTLTHYSPSSRVVELEGLLAGIDAKRNLWASLRTIADERPELDAAALDHLIQRATSQRERLLPAHHDAARLAFSATHRA